MSNHPKVLSLVDRRISSTSGHTVHIKANTPTPIPQVLLAEAMRLGCVPVNETGEPTTTTVPPVSSPLKTEEDELGENSDPDSTSGASDRRPIVDVDIEALPPHIREEVAALDKEIEALDAEARAIQRKRIADHGKKKAAKPKRGLQRDYELTPEQRVAVQEIIYGMLKKGDPADFTNQDHLPRTKLVDEALAAQGHSLKPAAPVLYEVLSELLLDMELGKRDKYPVPGR